MIETNLAIIIREENEIFIIEERTDNEGTSYDIYVDSLDSYYDTVNTIEEAYERIYAWLEG